MNKLEADTLRILNQKFEAFCTKWNDIGLDTSWHLDSDLREESKFVSWVKFKKDRLEVSLYWYLYHLTGFGGDVGDEFDQIFSDLGWEIDYRDEMTLYCNPIGGSAK